MKKEKLRLINELLIQQMNHWTLSHAAFVVLGVSCAYSGKSSPNIALWALCGLLPVLFYFIREKAERFWVFFLLHVLAAAGAGWLLPAGDIAERILCVACAAVYALTSFFRRLRDNGWYTQPFPPAAGVVLAFFAVLFQHSHGMPGWDRLHVLVLVLCIGVYHVIVYMRRYLEFVSVNAESAGCLPAEDMFRSGMSMAAGYAILVSVLLFFLTDTVKIGNLYEQIRALLSKALRAVLSFVLSLLSAAPQAQMPDEVTAVSQSAGYETPVFLAVLLKILSVLLTAAAIVIIVLFVVNALIELLRFLRRRFGEERIGAGAEAERENQDVRERCEPRASAPAGRGGRALAFLSPAERVRRMYRKRVQASAKELVEAFGLPDAKALNRLTARECAEALDAGEMAEVYESVRYCPGEADRQTVRRMRRACAESKAR